MGIVALIWFLYVMVWSIFQYVCWQRVMEHYAHRIRMQKSLATVRYYANVIAYGPTVALAMFAVLIPLTCAAVVVGCFVRLQEAWASFSLRRTSRPTT